MKPAFYALVCALLICGSLAGRQGQTGGDKVEKAQSSVTLTSSHPSGSFPVAERTVAAAPAVLVVRVTKVVNPGMASFGIFIYLSGPPATEAAQEGRLSKPQKFQIGQFSLFPADRPAGFTLRASPAFARLKEAHSKPGGVRLLIELKPLRKTQSIGQVEVTIAPPEWRTESHK